MRDLSDVQARLEASLAELEARRTAIARDLSQTPEQDWNDLAVQQEDDEALEHMAGVVDAEIASVQRALRRIERGTYGRCVQCGGPIAAERLHARPEAALCIACATAAP